MQYGKSLRTLLHITSFASIAALIACGGPATEEGQTPEEVITEAALALQTELWETVDGAELEAVALDDAVAAVVLLEPSEADEARDRLVDPLA